jgi:hypothetical protein
MLRSGRVMQQFAWRTSLIQMDESSPNHQGHQEHQED